VPVKKRLTFRFSGSKIANMTPKKYKELNKPNMIKWAKTLGITREYLFFICAGNPCGKKTALALEENTHGVITAMEAMGLPKHQKIQE